MIPFNISDIFRFPQDIRQDIRDTYATRREHAVGNSNYRNNILNLPLEQSLANLNQIEGRVESRIAKNTASGTDMTAANLLLDTAKQNLVVAANAVGQATSTVGGIGLHPSYVNAHFALNDARDSLDAVVNAIATAEASSTENTTN
jgi:hypothetical protein